MRADRGSGLIPCPVIVRPPERVAPARAAGGTAGAGRAVGAPMTKRGGVGSGGRSDAAVMQKQCAALVMRRPRDRSPEAAPGGNTFPLRAREAPGARGR